MPPRTRGGAKKAAVGAGAGGGGGGAGGGGGGPVRLFKKQTPGFSFCTKCLGHAEANCDYTTATDPVEIECEFNRLGSILCDRCHKNHDLCDTVPAGMMRDAWVLNEVLGFCHAVNAGTQELTIAGAQVIPAWGAASQTAAKRGSKELITSFAGALRAHKSEHYLEGPRHMQKKKRRVYDRKMVSRRKAQIARRVPPVSRVDAMLSLEESDAGFVCWQSGVRSFAAMMRLATSPANDNLSAVERQAISELFDEYMEFF